MTKEQKKFLMVTLPKFIMREQGRGFAMDDWMRVESVGDLVDCDGVEREIPKCGTVACIGGSAEYLLKLGDRCDFLVVSKALGLSEDEGNGLFYCWHSEGRPYEWPLEFSMRYEKAKTPLAKAKIAADLCKLVGKTEGKCLHR